MKVFLDTNVLLSAFFGAGLCAELMEHLIGSRHQIVIGDPVVDEFTRIARDKLQAPSPAIANALNVLNRMSRVGKGDGEVAGIPDPDDAPILVCALAAEANLFVTGDKPLLNLGTVQEMPLVSPRDAWLRLFGG